MEKIKKDFKLNYPLEWTYGVSIEKLKKDIEEIEKLGATHVNIEHGISYDCSYVEIDVICRRIETDEEFEQRKKEIKARQEQYRQQELKQLKELKAKYDNLSDFEFQKKIFNEIKAMQNEIQGLAKYVQNDFKRTLEDGTTTKKEINFAIHDMDENFDKVIAELNQLIEKADDMLKLLFDKNEKKYYCLTKKDIMTVYFKCKDKTGHTFTSHLPDAMRFNNKNEAIKYNHKWLYGNCEVVEY